MSIKNIFCLLSSAANANAIKSLIGCVCATIYSRIASILRFSCGKENMMTRNATLCETASSNSTANQTSTARAVAKYQQRRVGNFCAPTEFVTIERNDNFALGTNLCSIYWDWTVGLCCKLPDICVYASSGHNAAIVATEISISTAESREARVEQLNER